MIAATLYTIVIGALWTSMFGMLGYCAIRG